MINPCIFEGETDITESTPLYKYWSIESFLYLTEFKHLRFCRITSWPDAYEGFRYEFLKKVKKCNELASKDDLYGSCWSLQSGEKSLYKKDEGYKLAIEELESEGLAPMWESYCKNGGVRIKTTVEKMNNLLSEKLGAFKIYRGKVFYEPASSWEETLKESTCDLLISTLFMKRITFRYETEYRYIIEPNKPLAENVITVPINNLYDFIDEILVSPATASNKWVSKTLYKIGYKIVPPPGLNTKDEKPFCRISQLYGPISQAL